KDKFELLIASAMRGNLDTSGQECPDPETVLTFSDGSLDSAEQARLEPHFARCAICQRTLAALARGIESAPAPVMPAQQPAAQFERPALEDEVGPHGEREGFLDALRRGFRFMVGPFPLSVTLHVSLLLLLIITVHEQRGRELVMVNLEAVGGGGGGNEMQDLEMPEVPMPDTAPQQMDAPTAVDTTQAVGLANDYVRAAGGGGIGIGRGGGVGSGYGKGVGSGVGGIIWGARREGPCVGPGLARTP